MSDQTEYLIKASQIDEMKKKFSHPWNPNSEMTGARLGLKTGLKRTGVNIVSVPPGKESFVYHSQHTEEEWIYVLSGNGIAEIDGNEYEVESNDFMGFPTPGVAHHMRNTSNNELVYLVGGEINEYEIVDFPKHGRRVIKMGDEAKVYDLADTKDFNSVKD